ncbi:unnamed protein product [Polarella glacialis]|uniref:Photosystem II 12 kDa extrinsic protein n=1 Tax=Polarella glacialis TaxID=89957 RepID=A0A813J8L1_POLGL|nr:unnamed protein product [Polarella glacialis]|mmetsp:Transcript_63698/g.103193  ORF Transcript_63698/g.103193 Transcript_63698/m.103193 type:complete len:216 (-) Transcript_63698:29-676(-)
MAAPRCHRANAVLRRALALLCATLLSASCLECYVSPHALRRVEASRPALAGPQMDISARSGGHGEQQSNLNTVALSLSAGAALALLGAGARSRRQVFFGFAAGASAPLAALAGNDSMRGGECTKDLWKSGECARIDINNANVQEYRQYPGMFPSAATIISSNGPYKEMSEIYKIPNTPDVVKAIFKRYEPFFNIETFDPLARKGDKKASRANSEG